MRYPDTSASAGRPSRYAAGTRVDRERSRAELERTLKRYGAGDFVVLHDDAGAMVRFALYGRYYQLVLPLPDPAGFTHTPSGKPRSPAARQRAYEQALREQWRAFVLVAKGKLEAVQRGISTAEEEFGLFGRAPAAAPSEGERRSVGALVRVSRGVFGAVSAGLLVPVAALAALALPQSAIEAIAAPLWGAQPSMFRLSEDTDMKLKAASAAEGHVTLEVAPKAGPQTVRAGSAGGGRSVAGSGGEASAPARSGGGSGGKTAPAPKPKSPATVGGGSGGGTEPSGGSGGGTDPRGGSGGGTDPGGGSGGGTDPGGGSGGGADPGGGTTDPGTPGNNDKEKPDNGTRKGWENAEEKGGNPGGKSGRSAKG